jgi:hypothetical protein
MFIRQQGLVKFLMITIISSPKQHLPKDLQHSSLYIHCLGPSISKDVEQFFEITHSNLYRQILI